MDEAIRHPSGNFLTRQGIDGSSWTVGNVSERREALRATYAYTG